MTGDNAVSRRTTLKLAGLSVATAGLAGCLGNGDDGDTDPDAWEGADTIELNGHTNQWTGIAPDPIDGVENPTLVLTAGQEYTLTWYNEDGATHNIAFVDDGGSVIVETEWTDDDEQTLEFEATEDMVEYHCEPHQGTMVGDVEVHSE